MADEHNWEQEIPYDATLRERNGKFYLLIPELGIVGSGDDILTAQADLVQKKADHFEMLVEAGLLERIPEGAQVFLRLAGNSDAGRLARALVELAPEADVVLNRDLGRLQQVRDARTQSAQDYFQTVAKSWDSIRSLHVSQQKVEDKLRIRVPLAQDHRAARWKLALGSLRQHRSEERL